MDDMLKNLLGNKEKTKKRIPGSPVKEESSKTVPTQRFNDMIEYYTHELKSRLKEIQQLKEENEMLIKTSLKSASRSDEAREHLSNLQEQVRKLQERLQEDKKKQ
ncbi:MAG: hypothetical protein V1729_00025 [Candidatus Woesearchaeota archaeon]